MDYDESLWHLKLCQVWGTREDLPCLPGLGGKWQLVLDILLKECVFTHSHAVRITLDSSHQKSLMLRFKTIQQEISGPGEEPFESHSAVWGKICFQKGTVLWWGIPTWFIADPITHIRYRHIMLVYGREARCHSILATESQTFADYFFDSCGSPSGIPACCSKNDWLCFSSKELWAWKGKEAGTSTTISCMLFFGPQAASIISFLWVGLIGQFQQPMSARVTEWRRRSRVTWCTSLDLLPFRWAMGSRLFGEPSEASNESTFQKKRWPIYIYISNISKSLSEFQKVAVVDHPCHLGEHENQTSLLWRLFLWRWMVEEPGTMNWPSSPCKRVKSQATSASVWVSWLVWSLGFYRIPQKDIIWQKLHMKSWDWDVHEAAWDHLGWSQDASSSATLTQGTSPGTRCLASATSWNFCGKKRSKNYNGTPEHIKNS